MQYHWLNKQENDNLIIFFCGWSFDSTPFEYLDCGKNDVLVLYDYADLELPFLLTELDYKDVKLVAWSMGVWVAYKLRSQLPQTSWRVAINGTPFPVDDKLGIPQKMFDLTLKYAESGLRAKFYQNVFSNDELLARYLQSPVKRSIESRVLELVKLDAMIRETEFSYDGEFYDCAIVGAHDKIIPPQNQKNCWQEKAIVRACGHFPFYDFKSWDEILSCK